MSRLTRWGARAGFAWARRRLDDEARQEFEAHVDLLAAKYVEAGMPSDEARAAARRQFGNASLIREEIYEMNGLRWLDGIAQDVRYALRQVHRNPVFAAVVLGTLALGIGGTAAVFSVVRAVLLAPLPYEEPAQLVRLYQQVPGIPASRNYLTGAHFAELRAHARSFDQLAALFSYRETGLDLAAGGRTDRLRTLEITAGYFSTLGAAVRGREFAIEDEAGTRRVVLSHDLWRQRFEADEAIVGAAVTFSGEPYEVIGVAPLGFEDPVVGRVDVWLPHPLADNTSPQNYSLTAVGRLRNGVDVAAARGELAGFGASFAERWPGARASEIAIVPLGDDLVATARGPLTLVFVGVGLLLLVACVNVANLVLVRASGRVSEFAIRAALGSGRRRLARQLLVESLVLAVLGGLAGLALGGALIDLLRAIGRDSLPRLGEVRLDTTVLLFTALVTLATVVAFGLAPALRFAGVRPGRALGEQSRSSTGSRGGARIRGALAAAQLALALTLLAGAGVLLVSFGKLLDVDLGFRAERVLSFKVSLPDVRYDAVQRAAFHEELARRLESLPGVQAAGGTSRLPATGSFHPWAAHIETGPNAGTTIERPHPVQNRTVSGNFFEALGIPVLAGRTFDQRDDERTPMRGIVSARFAREAYPGLSLDEVIGQRFSTLGDSREIVGVVGDVALDVYGAPELTVYHPHRQFASNRNWDLVQIVASAQPPDRLMNDIRATVAALDSELAVYGVARMEDVVGRGVGRERFALLLMAAFAGVSLLLAALGLYGVLAYGVRQRTREIGIRMALGASAAAVRLMILRQAAVVVAIGLAAGLAGSLALGRFLSSLVFEISPSEPSVLAATAALLVIASLVSAWLPAHRASQVEPRTAMHEG